MNAPAPGSAVLFDLDGTLIDSAPDLIAVLSTMLAQRDLPGLSADRVKAAVAHGAISMLQAAFGPLEPSRLVELRAEFLDRYRRHLWVESVAFDGIEPMLAELSSRGFRLGVVSNKAEGLAAAIIEQAGWSDWFSCVVGGDTAAASKPQPDPVLEACRRLDVAPARAVMVGDTIGDVRAGRAAGTQTVVVTWGYFDAQQFPRDWRADAVIDRPGDLIGLLCSTRRQR